MYKNQAELAHSPKPELPASRSEWDDAGVYGDAHAASGVFSVYPHYHLGCS
jgi:hypothetical protein